MGGEGYYLDRLKSSSNQINGIGIDISKPAIQAAAKRNHEITWIVGTNKHLPIISAGQDLVLCLFGFPV